MKTLHFSSLGACNQRCLFCVKGGDSPIERYIPTAECKKIIAEKRAEGYDSIDFDGGEPTLRPDLAGLMSWAFKCGYIIVGVVTNGVRFGSPGLIDKFEKIRSNCRPGQEIRVYVSLHSHLESVSERLTGSKGTFRKTLKGLRSLQARKFSTGLYYIITEYNYRHTRGFIEFVHRKFPGISNITFSYIYPSGRALKNMHIYPKLSLVEPYFRDVISLCARRGIMSSISSCGTIPLCLTGGHEHLFIDRFARDSPEKAGVVDSTKDELFTLATMKYHRETKIKVPRCAKCLLEELCSGIWKVYADRHGTGELKPFRSIHRLRKTHNRRRELDIGQDMQDFSSGTIGVLVQIYKWRRKSAQRIRFFGRNARARPDIDRILGFAGKLGYTKVSLD